MLKKYWKMLAVAAFFAVAGICYREMNPDNAENGAAMTAQYQEMELPKQEAEGLPGMADSQPGKVGSQPGAADSQPGTAGIWPGAEEAGQTKDTAEQPETGGSRPVSEETAAVCFVHVCGEVRRPGVYELREGSRVFEAVERAGGFTEQAARDFLNLAALVCDGMKVTVPNAEEAALLSESGADGLEFSQTTEQAAREAQGQNRVNLNTATKEELMTLKGIGESRAEDIIRYREESGGFQSIEDIMKVPGIKDAGFQKIKDRITV